MTPRDLLLALLLPLPPWLGFWIFRLKGRVGLSYGYFLGGILAVLAMPWPDFAGRTVPSAQLGGALLGFSLFLQAHREGRNGIRRMVVGLGGATLFAGLLAKATGTPLASLGLFWATGLLVGLMWLVLSDLGYRLTRGRWLALRLPAVGAAAFLAATLLHRVLPLGSPAFGWASSLLSGALLGLVALQQLAWLRDRGLWLEGRGDGFRTALSALESDRPAPGPALGVAIDTHQPVLLVDGQGRVLEANAAFARGVGLERHQLRGYELEALLQGRGRGVWDGLRQQLLREAWGETAATLVGQDGGFEEVALEAAAFDRDLVLVWVVQPTAGTLAVRTRAQARLLRHGGLDRARAVNALGSLLPATERLLAGAGEPEQRIWAELARASALRLSALMGAGLEASAAPPLEPGPVLEGLRPGLERLGLGDLDLRVDCGALQVDRDLLERMVTHLLLHARPVGGGGPLRVRLGEVRLGGRVWARLTAQPPPGQPAPSGLLGLTWLQDAVQRCRGMLDLREVPGEGLQPRVYLPLATLEEAPEGEPLAGRQVWIVDRDPLLREALAGLVLRAGGGARTFADLRGFLREARKAPPHLAVLERTPRLDRFQARLGRAGGGLLPTLVLGDGEPMPVHRLAAGVHLVGFLEKPFLGPEFVQNLLALDDSANP